MIIDLKNYLNTQSSFFKSVKNGLNHDAISQSANKDERMGTKEDETKKFKLIKDKKKENQKKEQEETKSQPKKEKEESKEITINKIKKTLNIL